jgi:hypothetical protein
VLLTTRPTVCVEFATSDRAIHGVLTFAPQRADLG